ncbi:MAG: hypothetical protein ACE5MH_01620 [Terriglobia bacterium]
MHHFFQSTNFHGNVVFNFTGQPILDLTAFALGYHMAGQALAARMAASRGYADYEGYPILFLYRHALELYLKAIVYRAAMLLKLVSEEQVDTRQLFQRHKLVRLLPAIRAIFNEMDWDFEGSGLASFDDFASFIRDLDSVDPGSYAFRYPVNRSGEAHLPHHFVVNVVSFAQRMDILLRFLEGGATGIEEHWTAAAESRYELQQLFTQ